MARSNGPAAQPGSQPGGWPQTRTTNQPGQPTGYEQDTQGRWPPHAQPHGAAQGAGYGVAAPQQGYAPPPAYAAAPYPPAAQSTYGGTPQHTHGYPQPQAAEPQVRTQPPGYHYPQSADGHDPYGHAPHGGRDTTGSAAASAAYGQHYGAQQTSAPHFDPYVPPTQGGGQYGASAAQVYGQAAQPPLSQELSSLQRPAQPMPEKQAYAPAELRGAHYDQGYEQPYDQWAQPGYGADRAAAPDPRGYDLGGYAPSHSEVPATGRPDAWTGARHEPSLEQGYHGNWNGHGAGAHDPYAQARGYAQPAYQNEFAGDFQHGGAAAHDGHAAHGYAAGAHGHAGELEPAQQHLHEDGGEYEFDEPKPARRWGLIAASLVGAIAVGAGLAYGYRTMTGGGATGGTPVVKSSTTPAKIKPADPGGKQFAHTDSKIMGRLNDQGAAPAPAPAPTPVAASVSGDADPSGARKVQTMVIGRDGTIVPNAQPIEAPKVAAAPQAVSVPGMTIVDGFGGRPPPTSALAGSGGAPAPARPVVVNPPPVPAATAAPAAEAPAAPARPVVVAKATPVPAPETSAPTAKVAAKVAVPKKVVPTVAAAPATPVATGANGYVAVLASVPASQKSSLDALRQFADMQQKYGTALANKTPEVREANLGDKGTFHRLLVGPPGSREQAGQLCSQLKAAGHGNCWVTAY